MVIALHFLTEFLVASGSSKQTKLVMELGTVPILINLLTSPDPELREQVNYRESCLKTNQGRLGVRKYCWRQLSLP